MRNTIALASDAETKRRTIASVLHISMSVCGKSAPVLGRHPRRLFNYSVTFNSKSFNVYTFVLRHVEYKRGLKRTSLLSSTETSSTRFCYLNSETNEQTYEWYTLRDSRGDELTFKLFPDLIKLYRFKQIIFWSFVLFSDKGIFRSLQSAKFTSTM